jgi:hypothetical protein
MQTRYEQAERTIGEYWQRLSQYQGQIGSLEARLLAVQKHIQSSVERWIVVLSLSGRCSMGSIVEVLQAGLGVEVSSGYVHGVLVQARGQAKIVLAQLWTVLPFSGAIAIDEVFLREWGKRVFGVVVVDPITGLVLRLERAQQRSQAAIGSVLQGLSEAGLKETVKLCLTDMYACYESLVATHFPTAVHQFCWFHLNCFHIGATVRQAKLAYERAHRQLQRFEQQYPNRRTKTLQRKHTTLVHTAQQAHRFWLGAQRFQSLLENCLQAVSLQLATETLDRLIRVGHKGSNPYIQEMAACLQRHRSGLLSFFHCLEQQPLQLQRWLVVAERWGPFLDRAMIPKTTNAAEHVFRCLRRYLHGIDHVGNGTTTQGFFDLFTFFHNFRPLRAGAKAGTSLLTAAGVDVQAMFGSDDPYTILGFPPTFQTVVPLRKLKKVSSQSHHQLAI